MIMVLFAVLRLAAPAGVCTVTCKWGSIVTTHKLCCFGWRAACHCPKPSNLEETFNSMNVTHEEQIKKINDTITAILGGVTGSNNTINIGFPNNGDPASTPDAAVVNFLENYGPVLGFFFSTLVNMIYAGIIATILYICYASFKKFSPFTCSPRKRADSAREYPLSEISRSTPSEAPLETEKFFEEEETDNRFRRLSKRHESLENRLHKSLVTASSVFDTYPCKKHNTICTACKSLYARGKLADLPFIVKEHGSSLQ